MRQLAGRRHYIMPLFMHENLKVWKHSSSIFYGSVKITIQILQRAIYLITGKFTGCPYLMLTDMYITRLLIQTAGECGDATATFQTDNAEPLTRTGTTASTSTGIPQMGAQAQIHATAGRELTAEDSLFQSLKPRTS